MTEQRDHRTGYAETDEPTHMHFCELCGSTWSHADEVCVGSRFAGYYGAGYDCPIHEEE
jgi:hypothetical protein